MHSLIQRGSVIIQNDLCFHPNFFLKPVELDLHLILHVLNLYIHLYLTSYLKIVLWVMLFIFRNLFRNVSLLTWIFIIDFLRKIVPLNLKKLFYLYIILVFQILNSFIFIDVTWTISWIHNVLLLHALHALVVDK